MSQNATLLAIISPPQRLTALSLASGSHVTKAAEKASEARKTVSRWVHHDPAFVAVEFRDTSLNLDAYVSG
jgi:hypothetical protein